MINLKPFRQYSEHDVINLFSLNAGSGDEGTFVKLAGSGWVNNGNDSMYRNINLTSEANIVSQRRVLRAEVALAGSGDDKGTVLGIALKNVRSVDYLGRSLVYDDVRKTEMNAVVSGEALPFVKRGMFLVSGFAGTAGVGSGVAVDNAGAGGWRSYNPAVETTVASLGQFLGAADRDGYALVWIDC
jgi:hypothetical protein